MSNLTEITPPLAWVWSQYYAGSEEPPAAWVWSHYHGLVGAGDGAPAAGHAEPITPNRAAVTSGDEAGAAASSRTAGLAAAALLLIILAILWLIST